jgi:hypothetical protein
VVSFVPIQWHNLNTDGLQPPLHSKQLSRLFQELPNLRWSQVLILSVHHTRRCSPAKIAWRRWTHSRRSGNQYSRENKDNSVHTIQLNVCSNSLSVRRQGETRRQACGDRRHWQSSQPRDVLQSLDVRYITAHALCEPLHFHVPHHGAQSSKAATESTCISWIDGGCSLHNGSIVECLL